MTFRKFIILMMAPLMISCLKEGAVHEPVPSVKTDISHLSAESQADTCTVLISSNRSWNLEIPDSCGWIEASIEEYVNLSGKTSETPVRFFVEENPLREGRTCKAFLYSEAGKQEIEISQKRSKPTVSYSFAEMTRYFDPSCFSSLGGKRWVDIKCNSSWTAEVDTVLSTARGVKIETTSGAGDLKSFTISVSEANMDFDSLKFAVIRFHMEDDTDGLITIPQHKASILTFEFMGQDCDKKNWVFKGSSPSSDNKGQGSFETASGGYVVGYSATKSCYLYSKGFQCGDAATDFIEFPAVPGRKLIRVTLTDANGSTKPSICTSGMKVVDGGEYKSDFKSYTPITWNLSGTTAGEKYRIVNGNAKTIRINTLELEYE